jgi:hypothetical protein
MKLSVKSGSKSESRPAGDITFQPMVAGNKEFHMYHIKINPGWFGKSGLTGSEKTPGIAYGQSKIINEGITIIVPVKEAGQKLNISKQSLEGTKTSNSEAALALGKEFQHSIPGGGYFKVSQDKDGVITTNGYEVAYNLKNNNYDTLQSDATKRQFSTSVEYNQYLQSTAKRLAEKALYNRYLRIQDSKIRGEKDPASLKVYDPSQLQK